MARPNERKRNAKGERKTGNVLEMTWRFCNFG